MKTIPRMVLPLLLAAGASFGAPTAPEAEIASSTIRVRIYPPDGTAGFYRGTRFDWSGVIGRLEYAGHDFYPPWFQRCDPDVHDFTYAGNDIVAGPCTAVTGPAEEFVTGGKGLGFDEAKAGGTFIKIGVGVLRKPDDRAYDPYRLYPIAHGGQWDSTCQGSTATFRHTVTDATSGYGYAYEKQVAVDDHPSRLVLRHSLRNIGTRPISTSVYNHNFLYLDRQAPGPDCTITLPFAIRTADAARSLAVVRSNQITFSKTLSGEDRVYLDLQGFGPDAKDYDIRIEQRAAGVGLRITGDRPLSRMALWAIRAPLSIEPFIAMTIEPGAEFTWRIQYEYFRLPPRPE